MYALNLKNDNILRISYSQPSNFEQTFKKRKNKVYNIIANNSPLNKHFYNTSVQYIQGVFTKFQD